MSNTKHFSISSTASASGQSPQQVNAGRYTRAVKGYRAWRGGRADQLMYSVTKPDHPPDVSARHEHEASELYPRLLRRSPLTETLFILFTQQPEQGANMSRHARAGEQVSLTHFVSYGSGVTACCRHAPLELKRTDRMTTEAALVTCPGGAPMVPPLSDKCRAIADGARLNESEWVYDAMAALRAAADELDAAQAVRQTHAVGAER